MKIKSLAILALSTMFISLQAQKLSTRNGYIRFFSETPVENIEAVNNQVSSIIDLSSGSVAFLVPVKAFTFEKALMQEHFNENYMESGKHPKASFQGKIDGPEKIDLSEDGEYNVAIKGTMNIHGVDKEIEEKAVIIVKSGKVNLQSRFELRPEDYGVEIPASKRDNIAENVEITVKMDYEKP